MALTRLDKKFGYHIPVHRIQWQKTKQNKTKKTPWNQDPDFTTTSHTNGQHNFCLTICIPYTRICHLVCMISLLTRFSYFWQIGRTSGHEPLDKRENNTHIHWTLEYIDLLCLVQLSATQMRQLVFTPMNELMWPGCDQENMRKLRVETRTRLMSARA